MIPKIIHQTGPFENIDVFPNNLKNIFNSNYKINESFRYKYYNNNECEEIIRNFDNDVYTAYKSLIPEAYKADIFRMVILYIEGGIYNDLSQKYIVPIDKVINFDKSNEIYIVENCEICFIATFPKNKLIRKTICKQIENIKNRSYGINKLDITGPYVFRRVINRYLNFNEVNSLKKNTYYIDDINVLCKFKLFYDGNFIRKILDSLYKKKRDNMYLMYNDIKFIKMYMSNHKKIISNKNHIPNYGFLYNNNMVFIDNNKNFNYKNIIYIISIITFGFLIYVIFIQGNLR